MGLNANALWELWQRVVEQEKIAQDKQAKRPERKRQAGGGRKKKAQLLCRLIVALLYIRQHWTMQALAQCVDCAESSIWNYIHEMLPCIRDELPASLLEQWQQECSGIEQAELEQYLFLKMSIERPKKNRKIITAEKEKTYFKISSSS